MLHTLSLFAYFVAGIVTRTQTYHTEPSVSTTQLTVQPTTQPTVQSTTQPSVQPTTNLTINVTGYQDKYVSMTTVVMHPLTWFEARQECEREDYGMLWTNRSPAMYSVLDHLLLKLGPYSNMTLWEHVFRPDVNSAWLNGKSCDNMHLMMVANPAHPGLCLSTHFNVSSQLPIQLAQDCSVKMPSVCRKFYGDQSNDEYYPGYDYQHLPNTSQHFILGLRYSSLAECSADCHTSVYCIGGTYENTSQWCRQIRMLPFTGQYLNYTITWMNDTSLTHFVVVSIPGNIVPANSSYQPLPTDDQWPSCLNTSSTALPTLAPGSSTVPTTSTPTPANSEFQTTSVPFCTKCCHLNGTSNTTVNITALSDTLDEIVRNLTVSKTTTSKYRRQLTSAEDDRPSSAATGTVAVVIVALFGVLIFLSDLPCFNPSATK